MLVGLYEDSEMPFIFKGGDDEQNRNLYQLIVDAVDEQAPLPTLTILGRSKVHVVETGVTTEKNDLDMITRAPVLHVVKWKFEHELWTRVSFSLFLKQNCEFYCNKSTKNIYVLAGARALASSRGKQPRDPTRTTPSHGGTCGRLEQTETLLELATRSRRELENF